MYKRILVVWLLGCVVCGGNVTNNDLEVKRVLKIAMSDSGLENVPIYRSCKILDEAYKVD